MEGGTVVEQAHIMQVCKCKKRWSVDPMVIAANHNGLQQVSILAFNAADSGQD